MRYGILATVAAVGLLIADGLAGCSSGSEVFSATFR
jgi:hypothetical protein